MVTNTANVNCTATTMHFCTFYTVKGKGITLERNEQKRHKNKVAAYSTKSEKKKIEKIFPLNAKGKTATTMKKENIIK